MSSQPPYQQPNLSPSLPSQTPASSMKKKLVLFGCLGLLVLFLGCAIIGAILNRFGGNLNTNQSMPSVAAQPSPKSSPASAAAAPAYSSGGLGLDMADWERSHGAGLPDDPNSTMFFKYEGGKFVVQFSKLKSGNVSYIEHVWGDRDAVSIENARAESKQLIPADSKFVKTYTSRSGSTVDLYTSVSLKDRFSTSEFIGGKPGDFIILYRNQTGRTTTFIAAIGNNP
jgi:hypothetical protein